MSDLLLKCIEKIKNWCVLNVLYELSDDYFLQIGMSLVFYTMALTLNVTDNSLFGCFCCILGSLYR